MISPAKCRRRNTAINRPYLPTYAASLPCSAGFCNAPGAGPGQGRARVRRPQAAPSSRGPQRRPHPGDHKDHARQHRLQHAPAGVDRRTNHARMRPTCLANADPAAATAEYAAHNAARSASPAAKTALPRLTPRKTFRYSRVQVTIAGLHPQALPKWAGLTRSVTPDLKRPPMPSVR
jgi:hypothetical protein